VFYDFRQYDRQTISDKPFGVLPVKTENHKTAIISLLLKSLLTIKRRKYRLAFRQGFSRFTFYIAIKDYP
jgi:hypothetical protein